MRFAAKDRSAVGQSRGTRMSMSSSPTVSNASNEAAISAEDLFRLHAPFVARFLFRLGVGPDAIDDAVQEVFLVVHRQGGYRPGAARPTSYLANLALHAASAHRRAQRRRRDRETDAAVEDVAAPASGPVEVLETNESLRRLQGLLGCLDPDLRSTLILVEIEGETCASIAAAMQIPVGTVYWRLHQARKKFQKALQSFEAIRPRRELAVHTAGVGYPRGLQKERAGMLLLMSSSPWLGSEGRDLLRLGSDRHGLRYAVEEGLARHRQIAASGAPTPSWATGTAGGSLTAASIVSAIVALAAIGAVAITSMRLAAPHAPAYTPRAVAVVAAPSAAADDWAPSLPSGAAPAPIPSDAVPVELLPRAGSSSVAALTASRHVGPIADPAQAKDAPSAAAAPAPPSPDELAELRDVADAERALGTDPAGALALVRADDARFPEGYLAEERRYVSIMALLKLGRVEQARPHVADFLRAYPDGAFARRVREASRAAGVEP